MTDVTNRGDRLNAILTRIEAHDTEGAAIDKELGELGIDNKQLKQIKKAQAALAAQKKTLDALIGAGMVAAPTENAPKNDVGAVAPPKTPTVAPK